MLVRDKAVFELMWHPDLYFANARHATFQEITDDNFLVWVDSDGRVFYDCRISLVVICIMDLWKYPLDSQVCEMRILSYAYPESQLRLKWSDRIRPIDRNMDIRMPDMQLIDIRTGTCNGTYATGIWSCMTAIFIVEREMMHHVMQTYLPSALIVVISWFNFWLDVDSAPARVSLSITTLLTISTQANAVKLALPEVSYMKAIDVWMGSCMAFVFGVMIEFTICHFAKNRELSRSDLRPTIVDSVVNTLFVGNQDIVDVRLRPEDELESTIDNGGYGARLGVPSTSSETQHFLVGDNNERDSTHKRHRKVTRRALAWTRSLRNLRGRRVANKIDEKCRFIFPISFVVFNILYWSFYILLN
ncbi:Glycine receptor subunit beta-type 4 [Toxocara canis]|uniref:Glycine receptor subunit beta-type 4 n=1 Tax=Toxocara canis TaxID=6265 RepID=A0A0B2VXL0_TOXCA|nr:Glycine receptor subunit beta-type 4 [Toxocara canis]